MNPQTIWTSTDGFSWAVVSPPSGAEVKGWSAIAAAGDFVALFGVAGTLDGVYGTSWLSFDAGATWVPSPAGDFPLSHPIVNKATVACPRLVGVGYVNDGKFVLDADQGGVTFAASLIPDS